VRQFGRRQATTAPQPAKTTLFAGPFRRRARFRAIVHDYRSRQKPRFLPAARSGGALDSAQMVHDYRSRQKPRFLPAARSGAALDSAQIVHDLR